MTDTIVNIQFGTPHFVMGHCDPQIYICANCGKQLDANETGHFVPPSLGKSGFYICEETMKNSKWKWSDDSKCYYIADPHYSPPKCYCLGERYVYAHYGLDSYGILYRGSTIDNWGGYHFGYDLKEAIEWVQGATQPELKDTMWTLSGLNLNKRTQIKNFKLCYIEGNTAYFTTQDLDKQWGDDWNDVPYEGNAGTPYNPHKNISENWNEDGTPKWEIYKLKFDCWQLETPPARHYNSPYSVQMINAGAVAWLSGTDKDGNPIAIQAGASIEEFKQKVRKAGGDIYIVEEV